jgi:hypothetical protein
MKDEPRVLHSFLAAPYCGTSGSPLVALPSSVRRSQRTAPRPNRRRSWSATKTPQGCERCDNCSQFQAPSSCKVVEGDVSPAGWCKVYVKKVAG